MPDPSAVFLPQGTVTDTWFDEVLSTPALSTLFT
jgi:hypothetical protein